jgi:phosphatidylinositol alpha-1,6-mannosyltransferase
VRALRDRGVTIQVLTERRSPVPPGFEEVRVVPCLSTPLASLDRPLAFVWNLVQVARHARGSDLVHFFVEPYALAASLAFPWRYLITVHGTYGLVPLRSNPVTRRLFARTLERARGVVCVSRFTRSQMAQATPQANLAVINNGLEMPERNTSDADDSIVGDPLLLGVGALKPRKGYHVVVDSLPLIRERFPNVHYYLVGDDGDRRYVDQLRQSVQRLQLERNVTITGRIEDARLDALYRRCDAFVLPPVNSGAAFEGFGLAYLEANAYGKPVVGSFNCGAEDAIVDGQTGLLAPQGDHAAVARCILQLLEDPAAAHAMGERGRDWALARTWNSVAAEYVELYERALDR